MAKTHKKIETNNTPAESKSNRFIRVVKPRVNKAVKAISVIGYCAGSAYDYTPEQAAQIINTLSDAIVKLRLRFESKPKQTTEFDFVE